jgi:hypothetical protein
LASLSRSVARMSGMTIYPITITMPLSILEIDLKFAKCSSSS